MQPPSPPREREFKGEVVFFSKRNKTKLQLLVIPLVLIGVEMLV